jgi:nucleoside-diphosphate-sugar epimerase
MRVFVAGATGVIGQYLVPGLITAGHEVTASTSAAWAEEFTSGKVAHDDAA